MAHSHISDPLFLWENTPDHKAQIIFILSCKWELLWVPPLCVCYSKLDLGQFCYCMCSQSTQANMLNVCVRALLNMKLFE